VGVYVRISDDEEEAREGVTRQTEDCQALAAIRRWTVGDVYEDNDTSAYKADVVRERFEQMLTDLESGVVRGVVVYNLDRLARQPIDLERLIRIYEAHPEYVFASLQGDIDLSSDDGITMARVMVVFANKSSRDTARRVKRTLRQRAEQGQRHGGRRPWGWNSDGSLNEAAATEIRAAHERILAGDRLSVIQQDWAARGVVPTNARGERYKARKKGPAATAPLGHSHLEGLLTHPALAGFTVYRGEIMRALDGEPVKGAWDPICTPEQLDAVIAALARYKRATRGGQGVTKYLLSGIALCGVCGRGMRGNFRKGSYLYACAQVGCGKVGRAGPPVDDLIIDLHLEDRHRRREAPAEMPPWDGEAALGEIQSDISELLQAKRDGRISVAVLIELMPELEARRDQLLADRRKAATERLRQQVVRESDAETRQEFLARPLDRQRALILESLKGVVIHPAGRGGSKFNPDLIEPLWRR
jgi:DNA invertase Pin-like site-specific DNA recombinase